MPKKKDGTLDENDDAETQLKKAIGKRIRTIRDKLGHSAAHVAEELGISREALTHIETGRNNITAAALYKLACLFDCGFDDFFPVKADGHSLSPRGYRLLEQEDKDAPEWAKKLFNKKK